MLIRLMVEADLHQVLQIEEQSFKTPWSYDDFCYELKSNPFASLYVLEDQNKILGHIGYWDLGDQGQITSLAIAKEYRGKGYSKQLVMTCIEQSVKNNHHQMSLEVRVSNEIAIKLYQNCGFDIVAIRKGYYQDNHEDAYLMVKEIKEVT